MAHNFKIGDVVKCTSAVGRLNMKNMIGIVRGHVSDYSTSDILVEFLQFVNGHDGTHMGFNVKNGHGWFCDQRYLELSHVPNDVEIEE